MILLQKGCNTAIYTESTAFPGVVDIAKKVAKDICLVTDFEPKVLTTDCLENGIFAATVGNSALLDRLEAEHKLDLSKVRGKREVFCLEIIETEGKCTLVVAGSDKLGTIYGLFAISEYIGVSPMVYFGDAKPVKQEKVELTFAINRTSKEPSVRYRGFFINDEWPCFGNWTFGHFGGFTAEMYDHVFEFLLRMKGNYMWPAMWTSSFGLDGPGSLNEELADKYGICIAYSHHEPCLRASEEWDKVRGEDSIYGNEWNFYTNREGLTNYWADALKRSGKYNHLITIGMRGERDSSMLGENATLKDNIDLLKDIITTQRGLIKKYVNEDVDKAPQLLALYKEVEAYFYGDEKTEGLRDWDELENVIFMLCEDNFGHMRTLPTSDIRDHKGGFGMYYHFDYHGGPISYEWMPSTTMALTWEQMTQAYEYGIRDVWIVNVGDLKGNEIALQYFLTLAYDFESWGSSRPNSWKEYMTLWAQNTFPAMTYEMQQKTAKLYQTMVQLNFMRRPEALHAGVYHPAHFGETDRILALCDTLEADCEALYEKLDAVTKDAFYSLIAHPVRSSINLVRMHLYGGKNQYYAMQGRKEANLYGEKMAACIQKDITLKEAFGAAFDGKWKGMELEEHIGFTKWNDDGWRYPVRSYVEPVTKPRMSVSRADENVIAVKNYGTPSCIFVPDFQYPDAKNVIIEVSNDGIGTLDYTVSLQNGTMPEWLQVDKLSGSAEYIDRINLSAVKEKLPVEAETVCLLISDGETTVAVQITGKAADTTGIPKMTFLPGRYGIVMEANHFAEKMDLPDCGFTVLEEYGRSGQGVKVLPSVCEFVPEDDKPAVTYSFMVEQEGDYTVEFWSSPVNSLVNRRALRMEAVLGGKKQVLEILPSTYRGGENSDGDWCKGVINQIRITKTEAHFEKGIQTISVSTLEAGLVLERVLVIPKDVQVPESYLGPMESYFVK